MSNRIITITRNLAAAGAPSAKRVQSVCTFLVTIVK